MSAALSPPEQRIAAYLAEHDLACPSCGYQLRGCARLQCPECGWVILLPEEANAAAPSRRFWCRRCKYDLTNSTTDACPECGEPAFVGTGSAGQSPERWFLSEGGRVPRALKACASGSILSSAGSFLAIFRVISAVGRTRPIRGNDVVLAVVVTLVAPALVLVWHANQAWIAERDRPLRLIMAVIGTLVGITTTLAAVGLFMSI